MSNKNIPNAEGKTLDGLVSVLNTEKFNKLINGYIYSKEYFEIPEREDFEAGHDCELNVADCKSWIIASFLKAFKNKSGVIEMYKEKNLNYSELLPYLDKTEFSEDEVRELNKIVFGIDSIQKVIKLFVEALEKNDKSVKQFDEASFNVLFSSISEKDKDKKISPYLIADFSYYFDSLEVEQIQLIMEKTDINASSDKKIGGYFITNVIGKLGKKGVASEQLLKFLFSVDNLEFNNNLKCFYTTVTDLILHSKEYIDGNVNEAVKKVFSNSSPYEKLYEALCKIGATCHDLFNIETMAGSGGEGLAKMLLANRLFINFKDNVIQVGERDEFDIDELVSLLSYGSPTLRDNLKFSFKKVDKLKNAKSLCLKIGMNSNFDDDMKQIYNELDNLDEDVVREKLNTVKLSFYDAKRLISRIQIAPESLEEKDFDNFKTAIENFSKCWPAGEHDSKLGLWELLMFFKEGSLTGEQICELLDLTTKAGIVEDKLYVDCVEIDWILSRLKPDEPAPEQLLNYFCRNVLNAKDWFVYATESRFNSVYEWGEKKIEKMSGNINNYFWSAIYRLIIHSEEYIKRDDNGEKAIRAVLGGVGRYAWFKHLIKESLNYKKSYKDTCRPKGAITQLYNYKYREGDEDSSTIKAFDDLLKANNLKIFLDGEIEDGGRRIKLEAIEKNKDENKNIENVEVEKGEKKKEDNSEKVDNDNVKVNKNAEESNLNGNIKTNSENQGKKDEEIKNEKPIGATTGPKEVKPKINQENKRNSDKKVDNKKTEIGKAQDLNVNKEEESGNDSNKAEEKVNNQYETTINNINLQVITKKKPTKTTLKNNENGNINQIEQKKEKKKEDNSEKVDNDNVKVNKNAEESNLNGNIKTNSENQGKKDEKINTEKPIGAAINEKNKKDNDKKVEIGKTVNNENKRENSNINNEIPPQNVNKAEIVEPIEKSLNKNNFIPITWIDNFWLSLRNLFFRIIGRRDKIIIGWYITTQVNEQKNAKSISLPDQSVKKVTLRKPIMYNEYQEYKSALK